jgi:hypothetical protein
MRLLLLPLLLALAAGCSGPKPNAPLAPNRPTQAWTIYDGTTGRALQTGQDNRGQTALGAGQAFDSTEAVVIPHLTEALELSAVPHGLTLLRFQRSAHVSRNQERLDELQAKRKETAQAALRALEAGLSADADRLAEQGLALGREIAALAAEMNKPGPRGDDKSTQGLLLSTAPDQAEMVRVLAGAGQGVLLGEQTAPRASTSQLHSENTEDTTTPEDLRIIGELGQAYLRYLAELQRDDREDAAASPPPAQKPDGQPDLPAPGVPQAGDDTFLWKPTSENDGKLVVLLPARLGRASSVTVNGEAGRFSSVANGNRAHYRFPKPGSAYGSGARVVASFGGGVTKSWTVPSGGSRFTERYTGEAIRPTEPAPDAPASGWKVDGPRLTIPADLAPHVLRAKLVYAEASDGDPHNARPFHAAVRLDSQNVWQVGATDGGEYWLVNVGLSHPGTGATEANAPEVHGGPAAWHNYVIELDGRVRPPKR